VREKEFPEYPYDDSTEEKDVKFEDILNYPVNQEDLDFAAYDSRTQAGPTPHAEASSPLRAVLGLWNGFRYWDPSNTLPFGGMISMSLCPSTPEGKDQRFQASGRSNASDFTVSGECISADTDYAIKITFKRAFPARYPTEYWSGTVDTATGTITGTWGYDPDLDTHSASFILKRTAPEDLCFRPAPATFEANQIRALWSFARSAIRYQVRRKSWSWSFFSERRDNRKRFIDLYIRDTEFGCPLTQNEETELSRIRQTFTTADSRFYHSLAEYQIRRTTRHT
jgi:hypothetical protein